jgi:hypothetical protein
MMLLIENISDDDFLHFFLLSHQVIIYSLKGIIKDGKICFNKLFMLIFHRITERANEDRKKGELERK